VEEDGVTVDQAEKICKHALPMVIGSNENTWCAKSCLICYLVQDEPCDDFEPVDIQGIV
jgi:hypothetical protein